MTILQHSEELCCFHLFQIFRPMSQKSNFSGNVPSSMITHLTVRVRCNTVTTKNLIAIPQLLVHKKNFF